MRSPRLNASQSGRESYGMEGGEDNASTPFADIGGPARRSWGGIMFGGGLWAVRARRLVEGLVGDDPPFHHPVFVPTHHPREPVEMEGGTTLHFVTDGIESALDQARASPAQGRVARRRLRRAAVPGRGTARRDRDLGEADVLGGGTTLRRPGHIAYRSSSRSRGSARRESRTSGSARRAGAAYLRARARRYVSCRGTESTREGKHSRKRSSRRR